jgi:ATP-dependent exoDNAse (exonuclease V) beta subunit
VHHASVDVEVEFRDFAALSAWVSEQVASTEGFHVTNIRWTLTAERQGLEMERVRTSAVRDALNRARSYATELGLADDTGKFERSRERLYVGLSRARDQLVVCGDPEFVREVGGPDLARRLTLPAEHPDPETISRCPVTTSSVTSTAARTTSSDYSTSSGMRPMPVAPFVIPGAA